MEQELMKAIDYMQEEWGKQNNQSDKNTKFIYKAKTVDEVKQKSIEEAVDFNYALHRWYNFHTSKQSERIFCMYGAIAERDEYHYSIDFYINGVAFDLKVTVYPKALRNKGIEYNLKNR